MLKLHSQSGHVLNGFTRHLGTLFRPVIMGLFIGSTVMLPAVHAEDDGMDKLKEVLQGQIDMMKPELKDKVEALSTDTKMSMMAILAMHSRYSDQATLRQVMMEVLTDYQTMVMGIMMDSPEMTAV